MEFVTASDLFLTASVAILLSFLVAKLVSFAMATDPHTPTATSNSPEPITLQELCSVSGERLTVQRAQSESKVEFLSPIQVARDIEIERHIGEVPVEPNVVDLPVKSNSLPEPSNVDVLTEESMEEKITEAWVLNEETREFDPQAVGLANLDDSAEQRNAECIEEIGIDSSTEIGISGQPAVESGVRKRDEEREVALDFADDDDDDDWEGIERSELEKMFMAATEFVAGNGYGKEDDRLSSIGSDVQMELYALHKVATEGPCREPQPMALKLSTRAKWNAWQKLGNMSPEVAMEHYITLVSDKVPGWMKDNSAGKSEQEPTGSEVFESASPDLSTSLSYQTVVTERELDQESGAQAHSPLTQSDLENNVKK